MQQVRPKGLRVITGGDRRVGTTPAKPKLLDQMRDALCSRQHSHSTERYCSNWAARFIYFHTTIIEWLVGHKDVKTTIVYTHVLNRGGKGVRSPVDTL